MAQPATSLVADLLTARSDAKKLREENAMLRQQAIQNHRPTRTTSFKAPFAFRDWAPVPGRLLPAAAVIARPTGG